MHKAAIGAALGLVLLGVTPASAAPIRVVDTKTNAEYTGSVADGWEAWTSRPVNRPKANSHGYVRPTGGSSTRIPYPGRVGTGNIVTDGPYAGNVVFHAVVSGNAGIHFYDLTGGTTSNPPKGVNTVKDEYSPSVSGDYMAFTRVTDTSALILYRFSTHKAKTIAHTGYDPQVNGDYLAYGTCNRAACWVVRYQISTGNKVRMPQQGSRSRLLYPFGAVANDGTTYWIEGSRRYCGRHTTIFAKSGSTVTTVWTANAGIEINYPEVDTLGGNPTLVYSLAKCPYSTNRFGVYRVDL